MAASSLAWAVILNKGQRSPHRMRHTFVFAIFVLVASLAQETSPPRPGESKSDSAQTNKQKQGNRQKPPSKPQPLADTAETKTANPNRAEPTIADKQLPSVDIRSAPALSVKPIKDFADWGVWFFSLGLVIVGVLQVWLLHKTWMATQENAQAARNNAVAAAAMSKTAEGTLAEIREQTLLSRQASDSAAMAAKAASENASAAQLSAVLLAEIERPWVSVAQIYPPILTVGEHPQFEFDIVNHGRTPGRILGIWAVFTVA